MEKEGKNERNSATRPGLLHRSPTWSGNGWEEQEKMWGCHGRKGYRRDKGLLGPADPLPIVVEGRTEPGPKLGEGGPIRVGEGKLLVRDGGRRAGVDYPIGRAGLYGGLDSVGVEGLRVILYCSGGRVPFVR